MASRIMHYAAAMLAAEAYPVRDLDRFLLGVLLPDAYAENRGTAESHLKCTIDNGTKKTYDLDTFRVMFAEELKHDDLYRGYYLHLVQDLRFRNFVYETHHWNPMIPGNAARLHKDYRLLNGYVTKTYRLFPHLTVPEAFSRERICLLYPFDTKRLQADLSEDASATEAGEYFFFTPRMADSFIKLAAEDSVCELCALEDGKWCADMRKMAWKR